MADVEDVVQEAVCRWLRHVSTDPDLIPEAWLKVVITRLIVDFHRDRTRKVRLVERLGTGSAFIFDHSEDIADRDMTQRMMTYINQLPTAQRDVILALARGESIEDIALRTGRTPRSVEGHLRRARSRLRRRLRV